MCSADPNYQDNCLTKQPLVHSCLLDKDLFQNTLGGYNDDEIISRTSRCFMVSPFSGYNDNRCYNATCNFEGTEIFINTRVDQNITCKKDNEALTFPIGASTMTVYCPVIEEFCQLYSTKCDENCQDRGLCQENGKCFCFDDTKGDDCSGQMTEEEKRLREAEIWGKRRSNSTILYQSVLITLLLILCLS